MGKGTKVMRKSDGRKGVSTRDRDSDGEIKIRFDDDGSESRYINTSNVGTVAVTRPFSAGALHHARVVQRWADRHAHRQH